MSDLAVKVEGLSKQYRIGARQARYDRFSEALVRSITAPARRLRSLMEGQAAVDSQRSIWALRDLSIDIRQGEVVGIIGRNGAGKSTLLKILSRITRPTLGRATVYGRLGSLLEVGTGFHPELTGRENIYLNGAILGMRRAEINRQFDAIVDFSGVDEFIDTPAKHYSSGMIVRLAFAVAAHLEPEILVVDEVLAVGDASFQKKSMGKLSEVAHSGRTVLFVSHNMAAVENLCTRGIVLSNGRLLFDGTQAEAIQHYTQSISETNGTGVSLRDREDRIGSGLIRLVNVEFRDADGQLLNQLRSGQDVDVFLHYETKPGFVAREAGANLVVKTTTGVTVFHQSTRMMGVSFPVLPGQGAIVCRLEDLLLPPNTYTVRAMLKVNDIRADDIDNAASFQVIEGDFYGSGQMPQPEALGLCLVKGEWRLNA